MKLKLISILILLQLISSLSYAAPSFDCTKAITKVEQRICSHEAFAKFDVLLHESYHSKKTDLQFVAKYKKWLQSRNSCEKTNSIDYCLTEKYTEIFKLLFNENNGLNPPLIPHFQCFRPFIPEANGDQGFYAMRVISEIRGCGNLNLNIEGMSEDVKYKVSFLEQNENIYYYLLHEECDRPSIYKFGVKFEVQSILDKTMKEPKINPTLVMSIVEVGFANHLLYEHMINPKK